MVSAATQQLPPLRSVLSAFKNIATPRTGMDQLCKAVLDLDHREEPRAYYVSRSV
jgi:hypothetical protein